jgi:hypothetical protein
MYDIIMIADDCVCITKGDIVKTVHCKVEAFDVYIGRPSIWGNPFVIGRDGSRAEVIAKYKAWINHENRSLLRSLIKTKLKGKVLGCWCSPAACHGDILIQIANED